MTMKKIETKRTLLRRLERSDIENMQILKQSSLEPFGIWAADSKEDSSFIGWFMLMPTASKCLELGFMIVKDHWNKGLATEVCATLIDFVRSQSMIEMITANTNIDNVASIRTLEKLGFKYKETISVPEKVFGGQIQLKVHDLKLVE